METNLLPCPFCGFQPDLTDPDCIYPAKLPESWTEEGKPVYTVWNINCYESGGGCSAHILGESPEDCIQKWNTRTTAKRRRELDLVEQLNEDISKKTFRTDWAIQALAHADKELQNWKNPVLIDTLKTNGFISQDY